MRGWCLDRAGLHVHTRSHRHLCVVISYTVSFIINIKVFGPVTLDIYWSIILTWKINGEKRSLLRTQSNTQALLMAMATINIKAAATPHGHIPLHKQPNRLKGTAHHQ